MAGACQCGCGHGKQAVAARRRRYKGDEPVSEVARDPAALVVLERFGLNHCCGGHLSLREGAAAAGAELPALLRALDAAAAEVAQ